MFKCNFCGKECKSEHSVKAHQAVCKMNNNRYNIVPPKGCGFKKNTKKWIYRNEERKLVNIGEVDKYLESGWKVGMDETFKNNISNGLIGHSKGKALNEIDEKNRRDKISSSMKGNNNWMYNKRRGNGKKGWYNGIYCDSSWELAFLVYHIDNNLYIERCKEKRNYVFNGEKHVYMPDFITDEGIIEVKGRYDKKSIAKKEQNPDVIIYDKDKMMGIIKYVIEKYGVNFYDNLYK